MAEGRILVVDDEPQIRRVMRATLVQEGYEVMDARSGPDALDRLHSEKFDLILLDFSMPEMLARIRAVLRRNSTLPATGIPNVWIGDVEVDFRSRRLTSNGKQIRLS